MLRDEAVVVESSWVGARGPSSSSSSASASAPRAHRAGEAECGEPHREIDRELRAIARRKAGLEAEEARWLREAERHRIWRKLGFSTALEYLEAVFHYSPRTAKDRLRVAKALGELTDLDEALRSGTLSYSAARELSRVMTPATEAAWLAHARGKNAHEMEALVAGHKKGDAPEDPKDPALMLRTVIFRLDPRRDALLQQARAMFEAERGEYLDEGELMEALCVCALAGGVAQPCVAQLDAVRARAVVAGDVVAGDLATGDVAAGDAAAGDLVAGDLAAGDLVTGDVAAGDLAARDVAARDEAAGEVRAAKAPRPMHQIVTRRCADCGRAWQQGRGALHEINPSDLQLAECDAEIVCEADVAAAQAAGKRRPRPTTTIPTKTRDLVWARDCGRCRFPGCRATRNLAVHHIIHRAQGGGHEECNVLVLCNGHHTLLHEGIVTISGRAPDYLVFTRDGKTLVDPHSPSQRTAGAHLLEKSNVAATSVARPSLADVVTREHAKQALMQLGFKSREAKRALDEVCAHVGTVADVSTLVRAVLARARSGGIAEDADKAALAKRALVQSGFSAAIASSAVAAASAHVGIETELAELIAEAFRRCRAA